MKCENCIYFFDSCSNESMTEEAEKYFSEYGKCPLHKERANGLRPNGEIQNRIKFLNRLKVKNGLRRVGNG